jgi:hypothetical protein
MSKLQRDAFHRVPDFPYREAQEIRDGVESVPTRFMESHLFHFELPSDHEPENRKCLEINGTIFRFMGSGHVFTDVHTGHEPRLPPGPLRSTTPRSEREVQGKGPVPF